jgi:hypothetical protein
MAIGLILDFEGGTLDQYDQVVEKMDLGGKVPDGAHFHWVAKTDDGVRVVDVWEDPAKFEAFAAEKIGPLSAEAGLGEPKITQYEVHNILD